MYHVIKDPVHGIMQYTNQEDAWIKPFIDHPIFQRLRHIKQGGLMDYLFPGAVHTRFNHGLGCCYVASQVANKIGLNEADKQLVMVACLLHDIGHGPFSHALEDVFAGRAISHEQWTPYLLQSLNNDAFFERYNQANSQHPFDATRLAEIEKMIMHQAEDNKLLADIVSSQLDADRFDYLLRDSHFCGVNYGRFDLRWMLHCLTIVDTPDGQRLGISYKGVGVVEEYLMARRLMIKNIYHNTKKFAIEFLLVEFLVLLAREMATAPVLAKHKASPLGQFMQNVDRFNQAAPQAESVDTLVKNFLEENHGHYQLLNDFHFMLLIGELALSSEETPLTRLATRLHRRMLPQIYPVNVDHFAEIELLVMEYKRAHPEIEDWQLALYYRPQLSYTKDNDPIYTVDHMGVLKKISDISLMVNSVSDKYEHSCSLFVDFDLKETKDIQRLLLKVCQMG